MTLEDTDHLRDRAAIYLIILALLLGGSFLLRNSPWHTGPEVHTVMETVATLLAFIVGALALVRFYSRKQATFLFIGTGFLGAGFLDLNHTLITTDLLVLGERANPEDLFAWSWTAERVFLSLFLFVALLAWRQETRASARETVHEGSVYTTAVLLTVVNLLFFEWVPLTQAHFPALVVSRPAEFLPGVFFLLAFFGFLAKGGWRKDTFEHWLLISLLIAFMAHAAFMSFSAQRFDAMFDAAHLLKIASYLAILSGLMFSVYQTFTREGRVLEMLTATNEALEHEVEERARTQRVAQENRRRLQEFLDNANDVIQSVTPEGRFLYTNRAWKRALGYEDEEIASLNLFDIIEPEQHDAIREVFRRALAGESPDRVEVQFRARDGRVLTFSGSATAQLTGSRAVVVQSIFRDVTEQRRAERALADSKANLTALVENTGDAIWSVDRENRLITFNSAFALAMEARTGHEPRTGQLPVEVFPEGDVEWYEDLYSRALAGQRHSGLRTDRVDGQLRYFEVFANPIQGAHGISGAVLFGKDVTPRMRAEEALRMAKDEAEAANKAKSDFLANMSHELRTPLNSVIGFANILLKNRKEHLDEKEIGFLERILANGKHLLELINEVLDLAKVEAGRMELIIEEVDLGALIVETVGQLEGRKKVMEGDVALIADVPESCDLVEADSAKLKQVIINLVGNALKFTHEGSVTVRLEVGADGRTPTAIAVQDTGIGIPQDRLDAIFEAFQQAEAGTSRKYGGTGLGLAISRSICLLMGYDLIVSSEVGKGSTFSIVLGERAKRPVMEEGSALEGAPRTVETEAVASGAALEDAPDRDHITHPLRDFRVLVVDDEHDSRVLITHYLEEFGCQVLSAASGEEGIAAAREHRPDLITLDLMMPGMSGWEVLKRLKADRALRHIPVVVVSILAGEGRGRLLGAVDLITKPFERDDLLRVLWRNLVRRTGGRILVVDDDPQVPALITGVLKDSGVEVIAAADGEEALEMIRTQAPDAVLLDMMMPVMDGMTFLSRLREIPAHMGLPVIVLTAKELSEDELRELGDKASGVILKDSDVGGRVKEALNSLFDLERAGTHDSGA